MDHIMQHHNLEEQRSNQLQDAAAMATTSSISVSVSQVAFVLAAIASLSFVPSSLAAAVGLASSLPLGAALSAPELLAALCGFVATKKALFVLSNVIFLFLAADCRCFSGICSLSPSANDADEVLTASELLPPCGVPAKQAVVQQHQGTERCAVPQPSEDVAVALRQPELFRLEEDEAKGVQLETAVVVEEPTCSEAAQQELEKLEIDELNRKFEEFIQSRRIKWQQEEALQLQCQCQLV